jgi:hypothetical protein
MADAYLAARDLCIKFAERHNLQFTEDGSCGFGRPCVGFMRGSRYVAHNPYDYNGDIKPIAGTECELARPPHKLVPDAYHKADCMAVLIKDESPRAAVLQLAEWVRHLERAGEVRIVPYAAPIDAALFLDRTDRIAHAVIVVPRNPPHEAKDDAPDATAERFAAMELE